MVCETCHGTGRVVWLLFDLEVHGVFPCPGCGGYGHVHCCSPDESRDLAATPAPALPPERPPAS